MNNFVVLIAVIISRQFILYTAEYKIRLMNFEMQNKQYILLFTSLMMLVAAITISFIRKKAEENAN